MALLIIFKILKKIIYLLSFSWIISAAISPTKSNRVFPKISEHVFQSAFGVNSIAFSGIFVLPFSSSLKGKLSHSNPARVLLSMILVATVWSRNLKIFLKLLENIVSQFRREAWDMSVWLSSVRIPESVSIHQIVELSPDYFTIQLSNLPALHNILK